MKKSVKYLIGAGILLLGGLVFYNKVYIPKSTYTKITPSKGNLAIQRFGIGTVDAKEIYAINAMSATKIKAINVDEGEWVKKGQLLVVMDSVDLPELLSQAKISVQKAKLEVKASFKDLDALYAQKNLARVTYERYKKLKEKSFASQSEYDKAQADLKAIRAQIAATQAHIASAKQEVLRAQKSVDALTVKLAKYKLYAPVDGYVIAKEASIQESVQPTTPILKIVDPKDVWIKATIDERISGGIHANQKASITLRSAPKRTFQGYVKRIAAQSDAITQEREVDVAFTKLPLPFYINEQAEVLIQTKLLHNAIKVPLNAVVHKATQDGVWLEKNNKAHFQKITILGVDSSMAAVTSLPLNAVILLPAKNKKPLLEGTRVY